MMAGPVLFTLGWLVLGFLSPGDPVRNGRLVPYSAISQAISGLGVGATAPFMNSIFVLSGSLTLFGIAGLTMQTALKVGGLPRWTIRTSLGLPALGTVVDGIFNLESPWLHNLGFGLALTSIVGLPLTGSLMRRNHDWRKVGTGLVATGPSTLALTIVFLISLPRTAHTPATGVTGLTERMLVVEIMFWYVLTGCRSACSSGKCPPREGVPLEAVRRPSDGEAAVHSPKGFGRTEPAHG
jgi:Protein of unknown function (DUF998)